MTWTCITRTDHAKLRLTITQPLSAEEWDELCASLRSLEPVVVSKSAQVVTRLLEDLERPSQDELTTMTREATRDAWIAPEEDGNQRTFRGPLDVSVMGLRLAVGDVAVVTRSHREAHVGTMHRWVKHPHMEGDNYGCGHGGCTASVTVTSEPF